MSDITSISGWQDMTGEEIYTFCLSNPSTSQAIKAAELQEWMRLNGLYRLDRFGVAQGSIPDLIDNPNLPQSMRDRVEGMLSQFRENSQSPVRTDSAEYAPLLAGLMQIVQVSDEALVKFYELGGGRKYPNFASAEAATTAKTAAIQAAETAAILDATRVKWSSIKGVVEDRLHVGSITQRQFAWIDAFPAGGD